MTSADDSLLQCLLALCRYHGSGTTAEAMCGGLPLEDGRLTPALFERAAARAGLASRVVYRDAGEIDTALLPAVLLLEGERACVLVEWEAGGASARVIYPELNDAVVSVPRDELLAAFELA